MKTIFDLLKRLKTWLYSNPVKAGILSGIITWIATNAVQGIVGNVAYNWLITVLIPWLLSNSILSNLTIFIIALVGFITGVILPNILNRKRDLPKELTIFALKDYLDMSESLGFQLNSDIFRRNRDLIIEINNDLQHIIENTSDENNLYSFIDGYFKKVFEHLGKAEVHSGGIILRDINQPEELYFWRMSLHEFVSPKRFYIGTIESKQKGIASLVYRKNVVHIVNILDQEKGLSDHSDFHLFNIDISYVPYGSFICLPIRWNGNVIGVLTIEAQKKFRFDESSKILLQPLADQLGTVIGLYKPKEVFLP